MAGFFSKLREKFSRQKIDWDELEAALIAGDLGIRLTMEIIDDLQSRGREISPDDVIDACRSHIGDILGEDQQFCGPRPDGKPTVILMVGVNGTGKTTSSAKLANLLKINGYSCMLAAADTFRAAAIEQLQAWGERLDIPVVAGQYKADPSSVCFDAYQAAASKGCQYLICDTAGRLHTKHNLMEELRKTARVVAREDETAPHETFLVVDATTGSNGLNQAREFAKAIPITGLVVTKLDGSGKGGVVVAIKKELDLSSRFIGTGEKATDFEMFEHKRFVSEIL